MKTVQAHDLISADDLQELAGVDADLCVSLYMPTHPSAPESHQDPVRFRNLLDEAETRLLNQGHRRPEAEQILKRGRDLISDEFFWTHQSEGLAVFLTKDSIRRFRLPAPFEQTIEVAGRFLVTPIISLLKPGHAFYLLAISQKSCRLFRGTQFQIEEVESDKLPKDLQSALGWWRERELNFRSQPRSQDGTVIFHGHEEENKTSDLAAYLRKVAEPLKPMLHNRSAPLLFAGVEELFPIFRDVYGEKGLIAERVAGNPDNLTDKQLHQKAWPIVDRYNQRQAAKIWDEYHAAHNQDHATHSLDVILPACHNGLVKTLLIADGARHAEKIDPETLQIQSNDGSGPTVDILNLAAVSALRTGARVTAVPATNIPEKASAAAILRGPVSAVTAADS